jgi:phosphoglycolate phosphatase-like HAD superfamily hydrolase
MPLSSSEIKRLTAFSARPQISHVIFDMDGTLSWLRHGWPEMMCTLFQRYLPLKKGETEQSLRELLLSEILSLNGKPSMYQMLRFHELIAERGGTAPSAEQLLEEYQSQLDHAIEERSQRLANEETKPDEFVVHGARALLEKLQQRGLTLIILSGTIEHRVKHEAGLLNLAHFFRRHIYGGTPDHTRFSKLDVIQRILQEEGISGEHLLSFGDGPVEIAFTKQVGGLAVAVASDENENGSGVPDPHKAEQLTKAGADALIADYRNPDAIVSTFLGDTSS